MLIKSEAAARSATPDPAKKMTDYKTTVAGLFLRVSRAGAKSWRMRSRKTGQVTLGQFPAISFADAKALAHGLLTDATRQQVNTSVATVTAAPVLAIRDRRTLSGLLDQYATEVGHGHASWGEQRQFIEYRYGDRLDQPATSLTTDVIKAPVLRDRNVAAKRAARYLSTVLRWAGIGQPVANGVLDEIVPEVSRDRILTDGELRAVLDARLSLFPVWRDFTLASVLLMTRQGDHACAHASDFDLDSNVWNARISKTKGKGHKVEPMPLARQSVKLLTPRVQSGGYIHATASGKPLTSNFDRNLKKLHADFGHFGVVVAPIFVGPAAPSCRAVVFRARLRSCACPTPRRTGTCPPMTIMIR